jgi:hypothetical protein
MVRLRANPRTLKDISYNQEQGSLQLIAKKILLGTQGLG